MIDKYYILLVIPAMLFSMWASARVKGTFSKYSSQKTSNGLTGMQAARAILDANGLQHVAIEFVEGDLTDHYDPKANVIRLSKGVYSAATVSAVGVAAHEAGHAVQYAEDYAPIKLRSAIIPITQFGSTLSMPLLMLGLVLSVEFLVSLGVLLFGAVVLFQAVTLPVEYNASARAVQALVGGGYVSPDEEGGVRAVLNAAALTYVAALLTALANFVRLFMLFRRRD